MYVNEFCCVSVTVYVLSCAILLGILCVYISELCF